MGVHLSMLDLEGINRDTNNTEEYRNVRDALLPLQEDFNQGFVNDQALLQELAGIKVHWDNFQVAADALTAFVINALSDLEIKWSMLLIAVERNRAIMTSKGQNLRYVSFQKGKMLVLPTAKLWVSGEPISIISATADVPLFAKQFDLSELSASEEASIKEEIRSLIGNSLMETPPQYSSEDIQMDRAQLAARLGESPEEMQAEHIESAKLAFIERAKELITTLEERSDCRLEEYHPASRKKSKRDQPTDQPLGIGIMLPEDSTMVSQEPNLYLVHAPNRLSSTKVSKRTKGHYPASYMPETIRESVATTLGSLVSLLEEPPVSTLQTGTFITEASKTSSRLRGL
jgi:hypothetical protein